MSSIASYADKHTQALEHYTPCDVADALVKYGLPHGGYIPNLVQYSKNRTETAAPATAVGRAYTVLYAPLDDPRPAVKGGYIDTAPAGAIVVIGTAPAVQTGGVAPYTRISNALYGGLMSTRAQYLGCKGSVILGKIRDVAEHNALGYPVFAYGLGTSAPTKVVKVVAVNEPLEVQVLAQGSANAVDVRVINPGDYVAADENGVVVIPAQDPEFVDKVLAAIPPRVKADELVAEDIKTGVPAGQAQKARRAGL
jgi:regulator of RNase E activity RraA